MLGYQKGEGVWGGWLVADWRNPLLVALTPTR